MKGQHVICQNKSLPVTAQNKDGHCIYQLGEFKTNRSTINWKWLKAVLSGNVAAALSGVKELDRC